MNELKNINCLDRLFPEDKTFQSFDWLLKHRFEKLNDNYWIHDISVGCIEPDNPREGNRLYVQIEAHRKEYFKNGIWTHSIWLVRIKTNLQDSWIESDEHEDVRECLLDVQKRIYRLMEELNEELYTLKKN